MSYLLSIIVPTKNRYTYLKSIIDTFLDMDNGEVELVIQDNSDYNKEILEYLTDVNSNDLKYFYYKNHISVSENFDRGVLNSSGRFLCMIGDDDTVSRKIIDVVKYMEHNDIESAIFNKAKYYWPDMEFHTHKIQSLNVPKHSGRVIVIDSKKELRKCLRKGATSLIKLPEIYHGVVKRSVLDEVFRKCNTFFPGASPDMAIAVALSLVVKSHVYIDAPYTLSGQAYSSAGGQGARHKHIGRLKDIKWLPNDIEEKWESKIPKIWTGSTIYAESALKALQNMGKEELVKEFNYSYQYAWFISFTTEHKEMITELIKGDLWSKLRIGHYLIEIFFLRLIKLIENTLATRVGISNKIIVDNVKTSNEASKIVSEIIEKKFNSIN